MGVKVIAKNRQAFRDYKVLDKFEAGIALKGTEVKSLRDGKITLKDSFASVEGGELFLFSAHINPYEMGTSNNHDPERTRKLLMHKREIEKLAREIAEKGFTLVPLSLYFKEGKVKVELGLCRGKDRGDKRETIKERDAKRDMDRAMKTYKRG